ncbi:trimeric intracellular cation channel family protein [Pluralibacter gergoviae]|uniref:trimeric intracellular cation channel family protein n=1 Tax=Pluralibacter gergoviae TaxID=61647 RepID=UPI003EE03C08
MNYLLHFIDVFGTFIFSLSGAVIGVKQHFDIFGVFVIALVTAVGGGVIRDICLSDTPRQGSSTLITLSGFALPSLSSAFFKRSFSPFRSQRSFLMLWGWVFLRPLAPIKPTSIAEVFS